MNARIDVAWPILVLVVVIICLGVYVLGGEHQRREDRWTVGVALRENRHHATLFRFLFEHFELLMPEMEPEPEPGPSRRERVVAWFRRLWDRLQRKQAPTVMGADVSMSESLGHDEPEPQPDTDPRGFPPQPGPRTVPDLKQAASVAPLAAMTEDEWAAYSERRLAEAREALDAIGGGR